MAQSPLTNDGRALAVRTTELNRRRFNLVSPEEVDRVYVRLRKNADRKLYDCIASAAHDPVINHRVYNVLQCFTIDEGIHFLPADIRTSEGTTIDQYIYGYSTIEHDILDYERAIYKTVAGTTGSPVVIEIKKWVALASRIPDCDLFCSGPLTRWIVSDRLRDAMITHGITGCRFIPIEVSE